LLGVEILTNTLAEEEFRQEVQDAISFLAQHGVSNVAVSFGFTSEAPHLSDVGMAYTVPIADVHSFIADRERIKGLRLGQYDCWIEAPALAARFFSATIAMCM
jgi:hypothetical protein